LSATASPLARRPRAGLATWVWAALTLGGFVAAGAAVWSRHSAESGLPVLVALPDFTLMDSSAHPLRRETLRGRVWVADFIFTRCAGACPAMTARMARLRREVPADVLLVSLTVDPRHDTPAVLARYAARHGAGEGWLFVTGEQEALYRLSTEGFKLAAMEVPPQQRAAGGDGPFLHSSKLILVDGQGRVRGYYDSTDETAVKALARDAARVRGEAG
jgi:cytochrome oxidase Cu insertion factor (SCO1/SenC/PrrC family)